MIPMTNITPFNQRMLYLEKISYKNFVSCGYPIIFQQNGMIITAYNVGHAHVRAKVMMRVGDYAIKFIAKSIYPIYLQIGQQVIDLKPGANTITFNSPMETEMLFEIGSKSIPKNRRFSIHDLTVIAKNNNSVAVTPKINEFIEPKKTSVKLDLKALDKKLCPNPKKPIELLDKKISPRLLKPLEQIKMPQKPITPRKSKPRALLYIDVRQWCFHRIASKIIRYYSQTHDFIIQAQDETIEEEDFHYVIKLWYGSSKYPDPFDIYPTAKKIVCFYDMHNWESPRSKFYPQVKKNMAQADIIGYSCDKIKQQLLHSFTFSGELVNITDGVDIDLFVPQPFDLGLKLKVGWVGNAKCSVKNFQELSTELRALDFIEFMPQTSDTIIPHEKMVSYYKSIDVLVCFSSSEGTPNPVLEASACGRTWIATDVGIVSELLSHDADCGFIIKNLTQLCNRLKYLKNNIAALMTMGNKARDVASKHYNWDKRIEPFGEILSVSKTPNNKKVVVSTQYPRYGGAATCAYEMHRHLLENDSMSICLFFDSSKVSKDKYNPDNLPNVYYHHMPKTVNDVPEHDYDELMRAINKHKIVTADIYAFNYLAPVIAKHLFPKATVYYMMTGCPYINNKNLVTACDLLKHSLPLNYAKDPELTTIKISDKIVPNTPLLQNIFEQIYRRRTEDPIDLHEIFKIKVIPDDKSVDLLFVCSDLSRKVKGVDLLHKIFNHKLLAKYNKVVIGKNSEEFAKLPNTQALGMVPKEEVLSQMARSKIILIPSLIESYSITAIEATQAGCIVLSSHNAACSGFFPAFFVISDYEEETWVHKIKCVLNNYSYFSNIFSSSHEETEPISKLLVPTRDAKKLNVIIFSIDLPYVGGCGTNSYNIATELNKDSRYNVACIFITGIQGDHNPDNLPHIYRVEYDSKTYQNLCNIKKALPRPDVIFCKNYKAMIYARITYPQTKVIYSPSGLRKISSLVKTTPVSQLTIEPHTKPTPLKVFPVTEILEFIKVNDENLDDYAIRQADIIVPNSTLTHDLIDKTWPGIPNLLPPLYVTNISFSHIYTSDFATRENDVVFIAYDWKRVCKNIALTEEIAAHPQLRHKKIVIVGKNQKKTASDNVTRIDNLSKEEVFDLLRNSKVLVVPSNMDSNPNVIIEAIQCGCNVVSSINVGNTQNLPVECVVRGGNTNEWIRCINYSSKERLRYYGPTKDDILAQLRSISTFKKAVGIYKIPPLYDRLLPKNRLHNIQYFPDNDDEFVKNVVNNDIFYQLFVGIATREGCQLIDYILFDETAETNLFYPVHKYLPYIKRGITIWRAKDMNSLTKFNNGDVYFVRGTYYQFFKDFIPSHARSYFYPATSFKQDPDLKMSLLTDQRFTVLLEHSDSVYHKRYLADKVAIFDKFAPDSFICYNRRRTIHMCYVATDNQPTKNHHLFIQFINWLEKTGGKYTIVYVGNLEKLQENARVRFVELSNVTLINHPKLSRDELINMYNETKVNAIFSGRDACPRVVSESGACGCYNISLDTVSDGKGYYDGVLGELIGDESVSKKLISGSLAYDADPILWEQILKTLQRRYDYNLISRRCKRKYNLTKTLSKIFE